MAAQDARHRPLDPLAVEGHGIVGASARAIWHAWILQTREYSTLCERLPARGFIHHSSNDYLKYFDPSVGEQDDLMQEVKMLALYVANFGPFEASRTKYWLLASHLLERRGWSVEQLNDWLLLSPVEV